MNQSVAKPRATGTILVAIEYDIADDLSESACRYAHSYEVSPFDSTVLPRVVRVGYLRYQSVGAVFLGWSEHSVLD